MARAYKTSLGTVVVENLLGENSNEVMYLGCLLDTNGQIIQNSYHQLPRQQRGNQDEMKQLRNLCVKCVVSCYKIYLAQQSVCMKRKRVSFAEVVEIKTFLKDKKVSKKEKLRQWDDFGDTMRTLGLCSYDTPQDLLKDAMSCKMRR